ncbi:MAG: CRISPR-associated endoribonuclease Cas6, partial [Flavobacteriales bacterium]
LRFGYEAGFGEKNSLGMGCVENRNHNLNLDQKNATHEK